MKPINIVLSFLCVLFLTVISGVAFEENTISLNNDIVDKENIVYRGEKWYFNDKETDKVIIAIPNDRGNPHVENGFVYRVEDEVEYRIIELND